MLSSRVVSAVTFAIPATKIDVDFGNLFSILDVDLSMSYTSRARFSNQFCNDIWKPVDFDFRVFLSYCIDGFKTEAFFY